MKKIILLLSIVFTTLLLSSCNIKYDLVVYIPNDYMDEDLVAKFEKEFKVKVGIINFNSNEIALKNIKENPNSYDIIVPSDYLMEELVHLDLIKTIDWSRLTDITKADLSEDLVSYVNELKAEDEKNFDIFEHSIPYFWGSIGLLYNHTIEGLESRVQTEEWKVLEDQNLKTMLYDSSRDSFMIGLAQNNKWLKDANAADITEAQNWLISVKGKNTSIKSDQILDEAVGNKTPYDVAVVYSGDATYIIQENENYSYYIPSRTNVWVDGFVISKNSEKEDLAYQFINFFMKPENQFDNTIEVGYTPVRTDVVNMVLELEDFSDERLLNSFLVLGIDQYEFYRYNPVLFDLIADGWRNVKSN